MTSNFYQKKLGLIKRRITPDAPSNAIAITTFIIIFLHPLGFPVAIIIPPTIINTKEVIRIKVTSILVKLHIKVGNAVAHVTHVSSGLGVDVPSSIHFPIKGTDVLSWIPQHTPGSEQDLQTSLIFLYQSLHLHHMPRESFSALGSFISFIFVPTTVHQPGELEVGGVDGVTIGCQLVWFGSIVVGSGWTGVVQFHHRES